MGPKKDKKKDGPADLKKINLEEYLRTKLEDLELEEILPIITKNGTIINPENIFPKWNVTEEDWNAGLEENDIIEVKYPDHLMIVENKDIKQIIGLEDGGDAAPAGKGKDKKKGGATEAVELKDYIRNEPGKLLPRIYYDPLPAEANNDKTPVEGEEPEIIREIPENNKYLSYDGCHNLIKEWSVDQIERRNLQTQLKDAAEAAIAAAAEGETAPIEGEDAATKEPSIEETAYNEALSERDVEKEDRSGLMRDPIMCEVFKFVQTFGPAICKLETVDENTKEASEGFEGKESSAHSPADSSSYLWRNIWPKSPEGKPVYNPSGKYCVKLFLGGAWRKVVMDGTLPVRSDGEIGIATSQEMLELWPSILAKAIYIAYTKSGYSKICESVGLSKGEKTVTVEGEGKGDDVEGESEENAVVVDEPISPTSVARQSAFFFAFAVQALTGWIPSSPCAIFDMLNDNTNTDIISKIVGDVIIGGARKFERGDIPVANCIQPPPTLTMTSSTVDVNALNAEESIASLNASVAESYATDKTEPPVLLPGYATKKQHREAFNARMSIHKDLCNKIKARESLVATMDKSVLAPFDEAFVILIPPATDNNNELQVIPILAVSYSDDASDMKNVNVLVNWSITPNAGPDVDERGEPIPVGTSVDMKWISLEELASMKATLVSFDTTYYGGRGKNTDKLDFHWQAPVVEDTGKGKKGAPIEEPPATSNGMLETTLLNVDASKVTLSDSATIPLTVSITSDVITLTKPEDADAEAEPQTTTTAALLVLQQLDLEMKAAPLTWHVDLSKASDYSKDLPFTKCTFQLPAQAFSSTGQAKFLLRLFGSDASVSIRISSCVGVKIGKPLDLWSSSPPVTAAVEDAAAPAEATETENTGEESSSSSKPCKVIERSGKVPATPAKIEQILFRQVLPLCPQDKEAIHLCLDLWSSIYPTGVDFVFVQESETAGDGYITISRLNGTIIKIPKNANCTLVGRRFTDVASAEMSFKLTLLSSDEISFAENTSLAKALTEKENGNSMLSVDDIASGDALPKTQVSRFSSAYTPNNKLLLLRDVYTVDKAHFPLSLRFDVQALEPVVKEGEAAPAEGEEAPVPKSKDDDPLSALGLTNEDISLVVRFVRLSDGVTVRTISGRGIIQVYNVELDWFKTTEGEIATGKDLALAEAVGGKGGKDKGKGAAEEAPATVAASGELVEFGIEFALDDTRMSIPPEMMSRLPYRCDLIGSGPYTPPEGESEELSLESGSLGDVATVGRIGTPVPFFKWYVSIVGGIINSIRHDTSELEKLANLKNSWEEGSEGRWGRSAAAVKYYYALQKAKKEALVSSIEESAENPSEENVDANIPTTPQTDIVYKPYTLPADAPSDLAEALQLEDVDLTGRETLIASLGKYEVVKISQATRDLVTEDSERTMKESRDAMKVQLEDAAKEYSTTIQSLSSSSKDAMLSRVDMVLEKHQKTLGDMKEVWLKREELRKQSIERNLALKTMLERAVADIESTAPEDDPKAKGKKGKKKK